MLGETWNQVAEWGIETIKNIQTNVGLADEDRVLLASLPTYASKGGRRVSFLVEEVEDSAQIAPKAKQDKGVTSAQVSILKAQGEELTKSRKTDQAKIAKVGEKLAAARAHGLANDSPRVKALKARLHDLRECAKEHEESWNGVEGMLKDAMAATAYIHINTGSFSSRTPSPEPQRSDKAITGAASLRRKPSPEPQRPGKGGLRHPSSSARQLGSFRGRRSPDDEIIFKARSLSAEGPGLVRIGNSRSLSSARSLSSESSSPTRSAPNLVSSSQRSLPKVR